MSNGLQMFQVLRSDIGATAMRLLDVQLYCAQEVLLVVYQFAELPPAPGKPMYWIPSTEWKKFTQLCFQEGAHTV